MSKAGTKLQRLGKFDALKPLNVHWSPSLDITPEQFYTKAAPKDRREALGQFFTPEPIAALMAEWIAVVSPQSILDPAAGTGVLSRSVLKIIPNASITCIDLDPAPLEILRSSASTMGRVECIVGDFLVTETGKFDAAIANPPYLRHQSLNYDFDIHTEIGARNDIKISRLANLYLLFVLEICRRLTDGGRAAIIVPSEWMNANYGAALKDFLCRENLLSSIICFSNQTLPFDDALTTASILLISKDLLRKQEVDVIYIKEKTSIEDVRRVIKEKRSDFDKITFSKITWSVLSRAAKWDRLFEMGEQTEAKSLVPMSCLAKSRRGIATGANDYFHISQGLAERVGFSRENIRNCVGRAADVKGFIFSDDDYRALERANARTKLVDFRHSLNPGECSYIHEGESLSLNTRYVLSKRSPWYSMEECASAPIWAAVFGRKGLRFIWNQAGVMNLTTFHCLYPRDLDERQTKCLVALLNSSPIQSRAMRHRRVYGGGLLKFEPKDLLEIEVPDVRELNARILDIIEKEFTAWDRKRKLDPGVESIIINSIASEILSETIAPKPTITLIPRSSSREYP